MVLALLVGKFSVKIVLPLIFVDLVPRVGGLGAKFFSGMHWIKLGLEALKHARKPFPLLMRTDVWGQHLLALGPSRDIPSSFARDGDSIPFSMTWLSGFLRGLSQFPRPEMVLLLITVVLVPLVGKLGP